MATVYPVSYNAPQAPTTPTKGVSVNTSEVQEAPEYSTPAPKYNANARSDGGVFEGSLPGILPSKEHPELPIGEVVYDIKNHLICHKNFNSNIDVLMYEFNIMKGDLLNARNARAQAERELETEREERKAAQAQVKVLERALNEAQFDLGVVRADLTATEQRLALAISQLAQTADRLQATKNELRTTIRERDTLARELEEAKRQLAFQLSRAAELTAALDIANAGENAANDRNSRLTELLYQIEAAKARIERLKDDAETTIRNKDLLIEQLRQGGDRPELYATILRLEVKVKEQLIEIRKKEDEIIAKDKKINSQKNTIADLQIDLKARNEDIRNLKKDKRNLRDLIRRYKEAVQTLPRKYHRRFPEDTIMMQAFNYSAEIDRLCEAITGVTGDETADEDDEVHILPVDDTPVHTLPVEDGPVTTLPVPEDPVKILPVEPEAGESSTAEDGTLPTNSDA